MLWKLDGSRTLSIRTGARAMAATIVIGGLGTMLVGLIAVGSKPTDATASQPGPASPLSETQLRSPLGPIDVVASPDGKILYVAGADAKQIAVVDAAVGKVLRSIDMPAEPTGLVLGRDGATLYVTCAAPEGTVAVVDVKSGKLRESIPVGHWPIGPAIGPDGKTLYVCNRFDNNVAVVGLAAGTITLVPTTREPYAAAVTPDGKSVFVINHLPLDRADDYDVASVVTVIDTATNKTQTIRLPNGSTGMRGICVSPDGKHIYATHLLSRYMMPTTQLERGWMNTNALSIIDARQRKLINTVLLDDVDLGAANPWGVAVTADGKTIVVCHAGTHDVSIIDAAALLEKLLALPEKRAPDNYQATAADVPNDLAFLTGLRRRVPLGDGGPAVKGPRGLAVVGSKAFAGAHFTDNLSVVDLKPKPGNPEPTDLVNTIALGPVPEMPIERRGEMLFNDATICFQQWQSCASCHPDARVDALNWDLTSDGLGNTKNVRSMVLAHKTPPSMSSGIRANAKVAVRGKVMQLLFAVGVEEDAVAIDKYLESLGPVASPYLVDGKLSPAAQRGKKVFFDAKINCAKCHPEPLFTDLRMHDVGSRGQYDRRDTFDTPTLIECWRTAPYMHDGRYTTLKDLFAKGKHGLTGDDVGKLSKQQTGDLVEYVLSL
ncbi:MAG: cell surface protein [Candidatus Nealsonbacteria bacterium]|nr:cell surface protein [Candidatus Nealsonbacteria bacterium]